MDSAQGIEYNLKVYNYESGKQVRIYNKPLRYGSKKESSEEILEESTEEKDILKERNSFNNSYNRTKQSIYGIARSNMWHYFLTLTFDPMKIDSTDYDLITKKATKWLDNIRQRTCPEIKYLLVPELHSDGKKWHLHGLLANCEELTITDSGIVQNGKIVYNLDNWKYGFSTVTKIEDLSKVSSYIVKYITKELCEHGKAKKRYFASRNCILPEQLAEVDLLTVEEMENYLSSISESVVYSKTVENKYSGRITRYLEIEEHNESRI